MFKQISSFTNPKIKEAAALRDARTRKAKNLTIIEGVREFNLALKAKAGFCDVFICREYLKDAALIKKIEALQADRYELTKPLFDKIAFGDRHEGVLALCVPPQCSFDQLPQKEGLFLVVIEGVEKPGNIGAILRTADGAGVDGVIVCDPQTDLYNPNIIRASLGSIFTHKVISSSNEAALAFLRSRKVKLCVTSPDAKTFYTKTNLKGPIAIVLGSEEEGLSDFWMKNADTLVKIPMLGQVDSLNVSASTAVLLYEAIRQRQQ